MKKAISMALVAISATNPLSASAQTTDVIPPLANADYLSMDTDSLNIDDAEDLNEVVIVSRSARQRVEEKRIGAERLELSQLSRVPQLFGENDLIKSITLMPGVHSEGDGAGGFEVRGGSASENLVTLDGMTLYNPSHVLGIFSTFNADAINRATLYKGPIPLCYGEAVSSVLETGLTAGNMEEYHGSATLGLLAAKAMVQGPIVKDKLSFAVSGRRSYLDAFLKLTDDYKNITVR